MGAVSLICSVGPAELWKGGRQEGDARGTQGFQGRPGGGVRTALGFRGMGAVPALRPPPLRDRSILAQM